MSHVREGEEVVAREVQDLLPAIPLMASHVAVCLAHTYKSMDSQLKHL